MGLAFSISVFAATVGFIFFSESLRRDRNNKSGSLIEGLKLFFEGGLYSDEEEKND